MDEERKRILRMMAEGTISVEECDELLRSLSDRRREKTENEVRAAQGGRRPVWPYVLLIALALFALPASFAGFRLVPRFSGLIGIVGFIFWVWMIVDCLSRLPSDFKLLFTTQHKYEKWIWLAAVVLAFPVGAIVYFFIIRQPTQQIAPPSPQQERESTQPERSFRPARRARSLMPLFIITIILMLALPIAGVLFFRVMMHTSYPLAHGVKTSVAIGPLLIVPVAIVAFTAIVFWIWMLIDCLARDYREFGTLVTSDKSADKLLWILLILFLPIIGAIAYHISVRRRAASAAG